MALMFDIERSIGRVKSLGESVKMRNARMGLEAAVTRMTMTTCNCEIRHAHDVNNVCALLKNEILVMSAIY